MNWETFIALGTLLGGWESIKYLINRKSNKRINESEADKKETEADASEFRLLKETIEFLQSQLQQNEERFADQTLLVRKQNSEIIDLTKEKGRIELELQKYKCVVPKCQKREPQNGY